MDVVGALSIAQLSHLHPVQALEPLHAAAICTVVVHEATQLVQECKHDVNNTSWVD